MNLPDGIERHRCILDKDETFKLIRLQNGPWILAYSDEDIVVWSDIWYCPFCGSFLQADIQNLRGIRGKNQT